MGKSNTPLANVKMNLNYILLYLESRRCSYRSIIFVCSYLHSTVVNFIDYSDMEKMMDINNDKSLFFQFCTLTKSSLLKYNLWDSKTIHGSAPVQIIIYLSITKGLCTLLTHIDYFL
jgi:hypothetical protein